MSGICLPFLFVALTTLGRPGLLGFVAGDAELVGICFIGELLDLSTLVVLVTADANLETLYVHLVVEGYVSGIGRWQHFDIFGLCGGSAKECKDEGSNYILHRNSPFEGYYFNIKRFAGQFRSLRVAATRNRSPVSNGEAKGLTAEVCPLEFVYAVASFGRWAFFNRARVMGWLLFSA